MAQTVALAKMIQYVVADSPSGRVTASSSDKTRVIPLPLTHADMGI